MADLPDNFLETVISILEPEISKNYNISFTALLTDPNSITDKENIDEKIKNIRRDANTYIDNLSAQSEDKQAELDKAMNNINNISDQAEQFITSQAMQNQTPLLNSLFEHKEKQDEIIYFEKFNENEQLLVKKLLSSSLFVVNMSDNYNNYKIGSWIFAGNKNYNLKALMPPNELLIIGSVKQEINDLLDQAASVLLPNPNEVPNQ
ncbi:MAG: hypothetical protein M1168_03675 [Candidatus Marsarchaeota archaeon]|nr:hypothetical protein [Candidatus Marsarchaeota archaeon]MCL5095050.1 hypothetical protein [Candidatus Marsarchaeota archaeon]